MYSKSEISVFKESTIGCLTMYSLLSFLKWKTLGLSFGCLCIEGWHRSHRSLSFHYYDTLLLHGGCYRLHVSVSTYIKTNQLNSFWAFTGLPKKDLIVLRERTGTFLFHTVFRFSNLTRSGLTLHEIHTPISWPQTSELYIFIYIV